VIARRVWRAYDGRVGRVRACRPHCDAPKRAARRDNPSAPRRVGTDEFRSGAIKKVEPYDRVRTDATVTPIP
jgi:hypothetical protein